MNVRSLAFLAALALLPAARAQDRPPTPEEVAADREARFGQAFGDGLAAITRRDLVASEALFKVCIDLFPDRPIPYYNLACTYALGEKVAEACAALRESFTKGYVDLAHMGRDMDLDPIRRAPAFRALMDELEATALRQCGPALTHAPAGRPEGLLVWVHEQGAQPARDLERLRAAFPRWALLAPQGVPARGGAFAWDSRCEFVVVERLRAFADALDEAPRAIVVGQGVGAAFALTVAVNHPDRVAGVLAAGPYLGDVLDEELAPSGLRAYLVVHKHDPAQVASGVAARDRFVQANSPVVLERHARPSPFSEDPSLLLRGVGWLAGQDVRLPGAGEERTY